MNETSRISFTVGTALPRPRDRGFPYRRAVGLDARLSPDGREQNHHAVACAASLEQPDGRSKGIVNDSDDVAEPDDTPESAR